MVRWADSPLDQSESHVVATHWNDIVRHLPPPTVAWEWAESSLAPKTRHRLKKEGLVESVSGGRWRATDRLWLDVLDRAGDDEEVGRGSEGQELLIDPVRTARESRIWSQSPSVPGGEMEQQTLTGDAAEISNDEDLVETNRAKAENKPDDESGVMPGQLRLEVFDAGQTTIGTWTDILGARERGPA